VDSLDFQTNQSTTNSDDPLDDPLIRDFLMSRRSLETRRVYANDLKWFFLGISGMAISGGLVTAFLSLPRLQALRILSSYQDGLANQGYAGSTINRKLSVVKSLVEYAYRMGECEWQLSGLKRERERRYKDTTGVSVEQVRQIMAVPDRATALGKRDYAILRLLWENGLRRGELTKIKLSDIDWEEQRITIYGKGRGEEGEEIDVSARALAAIEDWLSARPKTSHQVLFTALDPKSKGGPLSTTSIYRMVRKIGKQAGIRKVLSPHRIRHSAITAYLDASEGDLRGGASFARHSSPSVTQVYDDNRKRQQKKATTILSELA